MNKLGNFDIKISWGPMTSLRNLMLSNSLLIRGFSGLVAEVRFNSKEWGSIIIIIIIIISR